MSHLAALLLNLLNRAVLARQALQRQGPVELWQEAPQRAERGRPRLAVDALVKLDLLRECGLESC